jgi:hypothetical protein
MEVIPLSAAKWLERERRDLISRVVNSPSFARSERLSALLMWVCEMSLQGREAEINEQNIGHAVFGRSPNYDSTVDGIVRTQASRLRSRLDQYFEKEGEQESVRISIPRGSYVPVFEPRQRTKPKSLVVSSSLILEEPAAETERAPAVLQADPKAEAREDKPAAGVRWIPWGLCALLACVVVWLVVRDWREHRSIPAAAVKQHPLWQRIFASDKPTLVVAADSGVVMFRNMTGHSVELNEYLQGEYRNILPTKRALRPEAPLRDWQANLADRRYTSIVDLEIILGLEERAQRYQGKIQMRYARDLRPNDLKSGNVILLGASEADPWLELFEPRMNFVLQDNYQTHVFSVLNRAPRNGEPNQWDSVWNDPQRHVFGVIAYVPNLESNASTLIVEGTSMSGTECAWDFLADDAHLLPFLQKIQRPDGSIPHFELVLMTQNMSASAVQSSIVSWRTRD